MTNSIRKIKFHPPQSKQSFTIHLDANFCTVESETNELVVASVEKSADRLLLKITSLESQPNLHQMLHVALDFLFGQNADLRSATIYADQKIEISRAAFYQLPSPWHFAQQQNKPETLIITNERQHPKRPILTAGTHYRRFVSSINKTISFRTVDIEKDLAIFHNWHNQPRVYDLWDLNKPIDELRTYLEKALADKHLIPMIAEADGAPIGYFEIYWAAEDRLAPYYDYEAYDRGFHFLIGERRFLGRDNTSAVVTSVMHMIFLDDERTKRIVVEPRADNKKVLLYAELVPGWKFIKEFDFPHKRAALLMAKRDDFFSAGAP